MSHRCWEWPCHSTLLFGGEQSPPGAWIVAVSASLLFYIVAVMGKGGEIYRASPQRHECACLVSAYAGL